jgi:chromosome segregation ATPase
VSNDERSEFRALARLEDTIQALTEELSHWRRRAHQAEADRPNLSSDGSLVDGRARIMEVEGENQELRHRVEHAKNRATELRARLRFLEEQIATGDGRR